MWFLVVGEDMAQRLHGSRSVTTANGMPRRRACADQLRGQGSRRPSKLQTVMGVTARTAFDPEVRPAEKTKKEKCSRPSHSLMDVSLGQERVNFGDEYLPCGFVW